METDVFRGKALLGEKKPKTIKAGLALQAADRAEIQPGAPAPLEDRRPQPARRRRRRRRRKVSAWRWFVHKNFEEFPSFEDLGRKYGSLTPEEREALSAEANQDGQVFFTLPRNARRRVRRQMEQRRQDVDYESQLVAFRDSGDQDDIGKEEAPCTLR